MTTPRTFNFATGWGDPVVVTLDLSSPRGSALVTAPAVPSGGAALTREMLASWGTDCALLALGKARSGPALTWTTRPNGTLTAAIAAAALTSSKS
jgi:hypothetical protein